MPDCSGNRHKNQASHRAATETRPQKSPLEYSSPRHSKLFVPCSSPSRRESHHLASTRVAPPLSPQHTHSPGIASDERPRSGSHSLGLLRLDEGTSNSLGSCRNTRALCPTRQILSRRAPSSPNTPEDGSPRLFLTHRLAHN